MEVVGDAGFSVKGGGDAGSSIEGGGDAGSGVEEVGDAGSCGEEAGSSVRVSTCRWATFPTTAHEYKYLRGVVCPHSTGVGTFGQ